MPIRREFIDWSHPALPAAADWLQRRYVNGSRWDLRNVIVAAPGGRAGRRLLELIVERAERHSLDLLPPKLLTVGELPEHFYTAQRPFADRFVQQLAWAAALRETRMEELRKLISAPPDPGDLPAWLPLAEMLSTVHRELAADQLNCDAVVRHGQRLSHFPETARWSLLADIQRRYLQQLDSVGLWDLQTARLFALDHDECRTTADIVILGAVDMNFTLRRMLDAVAERVTTLIFAPPEFSDRFDSHGCVIPSQWLDSPPQVPIESIRVVGGPGDQADAAVEAIRDLNEQHSAEEVVIGVPDERIIPWLEERVREVGIPTRYGVGVTLAESEPCRFLAAIADWVEHRRFSTLATLIRHPAIDRTLFKDLPAGALLIACDFVQSERLPWELRRDELDSQIEGLKASIESSSEEGLRRNREQRLEQYERVVGLLEELETRTESFASGKRPLGDWAKEIRDLLLGVFGEKPLNSNDPNDQRTIAACRAVNEALLRHSQIPPAMMPRVSGAEALRLVYTEVSSTTVPPPADEPAVELLGWLELPLDDAPALILTGMNESIVPATRNGDLFLPNELRKHLNLEDNDRRMARDNYALHLLVASRKELRLIAGRRSPDNDPLIPSRFLLLGDEVETARRTLQFLGEQSEDLRNGMRPGRLRPGVLSVNLAPPRPLPLPRVAESMRVTEFRDYLACPYRYYLRHRLKLAAQDDSSLELGPQHFGNLLHDTLGDFGLECIRDPVMASCTISDAIRSFLTSQLDKLAGTRFGSSPQPAVRVQIELARRRLNRFAEWQAGWARNGWRVRYVEQEIPAEPAALPVKGGTMKLRGRIDRIDTRDSGETVVFDYKSGDSTRHPEKSHWDEKAGQWIDLQLPLYRHACRWLGVGESVRVGYVVLPKSEKAIGHLLAEWTNEKFEEAVEEASRIADLVRRETFWPPRTESADLFPEFAAICGDYRLTTPPVDEAAEDGSDEA